MLHWCGVKNKKDSLLDVLREKAEIGWVEVGIIAKLVEVNRRVT